MPTILELDPAKVLKHFGRLPERGKQMKMFATTTVKAGMKVKNLIIFNNGTVVGKRYIDHALPDTKNPHTKKSKKGVVEEVWHHPNASLGMTPPDGEVSHQWVPDTMQAYPTLALKKVGNTHWQVICKPEYLQEFIKWLQANCQKDNQPKKIIKSSRKHTKATRKAQAKVKARGGTLAEYLKRTPPENQ